MPNDTTVALAAASKIFRNYMAGWLLSTFLDKEGSVRRLPTLFLIFAIAFAVLIMSPAFLSWQFEPYPLMKFGDVTDLLTPLILIPLYWLLFRGDSHEPQRLPGIVPFVILAALWSEGQGMHLDANSIGHLVPEDPANDIYQLTHFYDEVLSHYVWHLGVAGLAALLVWRSWTVPAAEPITLWPGIVGAVIYGVTFFIITTEAATAPLGVPFAILIVGIGVLGLRGGGLRQRPLLLFLFIGYAAALAMFLFWAVLWAGKCDSILPEFSSSCVGMID